MCYEKTAIWCEGATDLLGKCPDLFFFFFFPNHGILAQPWVHLSGMQTPSIPAPGPVQGFQGPLGGQRAPYTALPREVRSISQPAAGSRPGGHGPSTPLPFRPQSRRLCRSQNCPVHTVHVTVIAGHHRGVLHLSCSAHAVSPPGGVHPTLLRNKN